MALRIVKNATFNSDVFQVGSEAKSRTPKGYFLETFRKRCPSVDAETVLRDLEDNAVSLAIQHLEKKMAHRFQEEHKKIHDHYKKEFTKTLLDIESELVDLVLALSVKLFRKEVGLDRTTVIEWVKEALNRLNDEKTATVRINPADMDVISRFKDEISMIQKGMTGIVYECDLGIEQGGCVVEGKFVKVDATVETRIQELKNELKAA